MAQTVSPQPGAPAKSRPPLPAQALAGRPEWLTAETLSLFLAGGILLLGWLVLWNKLRGEWATNEQYGYGWFVPPLALLLLALRWVDRPAPRPGGRFAMGAIVLALVAAVLLPPIRLIEQPNPDWRLMFWAHSGALLCLSLALFSWLGGRPWVRHFAFPIAFLLLAVPWPSGPEQTAVQSLMRGVATISAEIMNLLGIPAQAHGNLIRIRDQTVGVSEACSGIRSLQATLMAGLLFGELSRHPWRQRLILLSAGVGFAMAANVMRSSLLVWFAARDGAAGLEKVHDSVGFSVLIIVFAGLFAINRWLGAPSATQPGASSPRDNVSAPRRLAPAFLLAAAGWFAVVEAGCAAWYGLYTSPRPDVPRWTVQAPAGAPGFQPLKIDRRSTDILHYDHEVAAQWTNPTLPGSVCTMYFFRWEAEHASTTQAEMHQPHICLTGSGLTQTADWGYQPYTLPGGLQLPMRRYEFTSYGRTVHVFFLAWQDRNGALILASAAGARRERLRAVAEHQTNLGRQTLEIVVVGPQTAEQANAWFEGELARLVRPLDSLAVRAD